jgi:hypothetical protein
MLGATLFILAKSNVYCTTNVHTLYNKADLSSIFLKKKCENHFHISFVVQSVYIVVQETLLFG